jgi:hypothetical protein
MLRKPATTLQLKAGMRAFVSIPRRDHADMVTAALVAKGVVVLGASSLQTNVLVVDDPSRLQKPERWIAALTGALVCSAPAVFSQVGPFLKYSVAVRKPTRLYLTPEFRAKHALVTALLTEACNLPGSAWKMIAVRQGRVLVLGGPNGKTAKQFLRAITCIIRTESRSK